MGVLPVYREDRCQSISVIDDICRLRVEHVYTYSIGNRNLTFFRDDDDEFICVSLHKTPKMLLFLSDVHKRGDKMLLLK